MVKSLHSSLLFCFILLFSLPTLAQQAIPQLTRIDEDAANITLDGFVDEAVWRDLPVSDGMRVIDPDTLAEVPYKTDIRMFYTEQGIYVGVVNHQPAETLVARRTSDALSFGQVRRARSMRISDAFWR